MVFDSLDIRLHRLEEECDKVPAADASICSRTQDVRNAYIAGAIITQGSGLQQDFLTYVLTAIDDAEQACVTEHAKRIIRECREEVLSGKRMPLWTEQG